MKSNTWATEAQMTGLAVELSLCFMVGTMIYSVGGYLGGYTDQVEVFNLVTKEWRSGEYQRRNSLKFADYIYSLSLSLNSNLYFLQHKTNSHTK